MSTDHIDDQPDSNVVPLRAKDAGTEAGLNDTPAPAYADVTADSIGKRMPIIPQHLQRENLWGTLSQAAGLHWHRARYHRVRSPAYLARTLFYALSGGHRLPAPGPRVPAN